MTASRSKRVARFGSAYYAGRHVGWTEALRLIALRLGRRGRRKYRRDDFELRA